MFVPVVDSNVSHLSNFSVFSPYSVPLVSPEEKSSKGYTPKNPSKKHHKKERNNKVATSFTTTNMSAVIDLQLKHPNESIALKQSSGNLNSNSRVIVHDASESIQEEGNIPDGAYIPCENNKNSAADISASATVANANDNDMESSNEIAEIAISAINSNE